MFNNAVMLAGVAGAMLPLLLHTLNRARYRRVEWGAMMLLDDPQVRRTARRKQWGLLILRMGLVAMLAIALARPVLGSGSEDQPACVVVLLDRSASMDFNEGGRSRMSAARRAALNVLASLRRGDEAAVLLMPPGAQPPQFTTDIQSLAARVGDVRSVAGRADIASALSAARTLLEQSRAAHQSLVVIADRQAASWAGIDDPFASRWRTPTGPQQPAAPRVYTIPIGGEHGGTVAIESIAVANPPIVRGCAADVDVRVANHDVTPRTEMPIVLETPGGQRLHSGALHLEPGESTTYRCQITLAEPGSRYFTARVGSDPRQWRSQMDCAVTVVEPIAVLIVGATMEPAAPGSSQLDAADFAELALAPFARTGQAGVDPARIDRSTSTRWTRLDRAAHQVVVLTEPGSLTEPQIRELEQYAYDGGGIIVIPRLTGQYDPLWRAGESILPCELLPPVTLEPSSIPTLQAPDLSHPVFSFLRSDPEPRPELRVTRYFPVQLNEARCSVLARLADDSPFLVEGSYGRGRVLLFTVALGDDSSNLALSGLFLPLLQNAVRHVASGVAPDRNLSFGDALVVALPGPPPGGVTIEGPGIAVTRLTPTVSGSGFEVRYPAAARSGRYTMRLWNGTVQQPIHFVVRPASGESDLSSLSAREFDAINKRVGARALGDFEIATVAQSLEAPRHRIELWPILLLTVLALTVVELAVARQWASIPEDRV